MEFNFVHEDHNFLNDSLESYMVTLENEEPELFALLQTRIQPGQSPTDDQSTQISSTRDNRNEGADQHFNYTRTDEIYLPLIESYRILQNFSLHDQVVDEGNRIFRIIIDMDDVIKSSKDMLDSLFAMHNSLAMHFTVTLRSGNQDHIMGGSFVGQDSGGPFQRWLIRLADILFSPRAGLFLPAVCGDPAMLRISPIPGLGCVDAAVGAQLGAVGHELYRLVGRAMGFALRPRPDQPRRSAFCLGRSARLVPSAWRHVLAGAEYKPDLHELRCGVLGARARIRSQTRGGAGG